MKLTLFMLVTPPDLAIAKYTIASLKKTLLRVKQISAVIFLNGLSEQEEFEVYKIIGNMREMIVVKSNREKLLEIEKDIKIGEFYTTDNGAVNLREGRWESCGEVWSRELVLIDSPLIGMIDADFEIFDASFINEMRAGFIKNERLGFFSTDYDPDQKLVEFLSPIEFIAAKRYHTWFCIYRKTVLEVCHDFSLKWEIDNKTGLTWKYDHSGMLQKKMMDLGWQGLSLNRNNYWKYLHYGAFSKNRSLSGIKLGIYRFIKICSYNGYRHIHHLPMLEKILRKIGRIFYVRLLGFDKYDNNRYRYFFEVLEPRNQLH